MYSCTVTCHTSKICWSSLFESVTKGKKQKKKRINIVPTTLQTWLHKSGIQNCAILSVQKECFYVKRNLRIWAPPLMKPDSTYLDSHHPITGDKSRKVWLPKSQVIPFFIYLFVIFFLSVPPPEECNPDSLGKNANSLWVPSNYLPNNLIHTTVTVWQLSLMN